MQARFLVDLVVAADSKRDVSLRAGFCAGAAPGATIGNLKAPSHAKTVSPKGKRCVNDGALPKVQVVAAAVVHEEHLACVARFAGIQGVHGRVESEHPVNEGPLFCIARPHGATAKPASAVIDRLPHDGNNGVGHQLRIECLPARCEEIQPSAFRVHHVDHASARQPVGIQCREDAVAYFPQESQEVVRVYLSRTRDGNRRAPCEADGVYRCRIDSLPAHDAPFCTFGGGAHEACSRRIPFRISLKLAVAVCPRLRIGDGFHDVPVLGDLALFHAPQIVVGGRSAAEGALAHRKHEVALGQYLMGGVVDYLDTGVSQGLQSGAQAGKTVGDARVVL